MIYIYVWCSDHSPPARTVPHQHGGPFPPTRTIPPQCFAYWGGMVRGPFPPKNALKTDRSPPHSLFFRFSLPCVQYFSLCSQFLG